VNKSAVSFSNIHAVMIVIFSEKNKSIDKKSETSYQKDRPVGNREEKRGYLFAICNSKPAPSAKLK
jgi:hypothetical protein